MWSRHTSIVPKGYLRYQVLRLLNTKPMSGSEIMKQLEEQTDGRWRPSPGSIYPLLAWLQDNLYIEETASEAGVKRYKLTESGKIFLNEHEKFQNSMQNHLEHFRRNLGFVGLGWQHHFTNKSFHAIYHSARNLMHALRDYEKSMKNQSEKDSLEVKAVLDEATVKIKAITQRLEK